MKEKRKKGRNKHCTFFIITQCNPRIAKKKERKKFDRKFNNI